jgi:hypothetical protein
MNLIKIMEQLNTIEILTTQRHICITLLLLNQNKHYKWMHIKKQDLCKNK